MQIDVTWPGATAPQMLDQVAARIEKPLLDLPELETITSSARPGHAELAIALKEGLSAEKIRQTFQLVRNRLNEVSRELPPGVIGPVINDELGVPTGVVVVFSGEGVALPVLRELGERARLEFLQIKGVSKAALLGVQPEKIYLEFDPARLFNFNLDPEAVMTQLREQNSSTSGGRLQATVTGAFKSETDLRDAPIRAGERTLTVSDFAQVRRSVIDPPQQFIRWQGQPAVAVALGIDRRASAQSVAAALAAVEVKIKAELPLGVEMGRLVDQTEVVARATSEFTKALLEAVVVVLAVSFVALGWRAGAVVAISVPLVLAITLTFMWVLGIELHRVSLGALIIALGLLVDDAMISVEAMVGRLERNWSSVRAATFAYRTTAFAMLTGTTITAAGFLPVGLARSDAGSYTVSLFIVIAVALAASWVVAVVFVPYLGFLLLPSGGVNRLAGTGPTKTLRHPFYKRFRKIVSWAIVHRWTVIASVIALTLASLYAFRFVPQQFFPLTDRHELIIEGWLPEDSSIENSLSRVVSIEKLIDSYSEGLTQASFVGSAPPNFYLSLRGQTPHPGYFSLVVVAPSVATRDRVHLQLLSDLEKGYPDLRVKVSRLSSGPPVSYPVQFRVLGDDQAQVRHAADRVAVLVQADPGARDVYSEWNEVLKSLQVKVDQDRARLVGVSSTKVADSIRGLLEGVSVTTVRVRDLAIEVVARADAQTRLDPSRLHELPVRSDRRSVRLGQIGEVTWGIDDARLWRRNGRVLVTVSANVTDNTQPVDLTARLLPKMAALTDSLPSGVRIEAGGVYEATLSSQQSIDEVVPLMLLIVISLLVVQLRSVNGAIRVLLSAPLGIVGVVWALLLLNQPFGFVAMLGVVALAGIIIRNSVILVENIDQFMRRGVDLRLAIVEATVRRVRPVLLTAAATVLAMIPLAQDGFWRPMAVAMIGGVTVSTLLTLVFEPAMYAAWYRVGATKRKRIEVRGYLMSLNRKIAVKAFQKTKFLE